MNPSSAAAIRAFSPAVQHHVRSHVALIGVLLLIGFVVWPIYLFPAGYPQLVTFVLVVSFGILCLFEPEAIAKLLRQEEILLLSAFVGYTLLANSVAALGGQDPEPLLHSLYYLQVLLACIVAVFVFRNWARAPSAVHVAVIAALAVQVLALVVTGIEEGGRATLMFANPNQLGFFALLALAYILHLHANAGSSIILTYFGAGIAIILVLASLSKAAIIATVVLVLLHVCIGPLQGGAIRRSRPLFILALPTVLAVLIVVYRDEIAFAEVVFDRLATIGLTEDDSLTGRGYSRITEWPQYLFFGAGEGLVGRWGAQSEIHSMMGTLLFSYGLPGLTIVAALHVVIWRRNTRDMLIYGLPILLYSLTHQPMRQPMMWILLMLIAHASKPQRASASTSVGRTHEL